MIKNTQNILSYDLVHKQPFGYQVHGYLFRVVTDQAEKNLLNFNKTFPDLSKSNSQVKLILKYIIKHLKLYKSSNLIFIQVKTTFFDEFNHLTSITSLEPSVYD